MRPALTTISLLLLLAGSSLAVTREDIEPYEGWTVTEITVVGNSVTKEGVILRELLTGVGDPLVVDFLFADTQRLDNLGIFSEVDLFVYKHASGVGVEYRFKELPWIVPYIKFKFTEENGWSVGPTLTSVNMFGRDVYLSGFALFGGTNSFSIKFSHPWIMDDRVSLDIDAAMLGRTNVLYDFEEDTEEFTFWLGKWIGTPGRVRLGASYFTVASDRDSVTLSPDNKDQMHRVGGALGYDSRDSWLNPRAGWENEVEVIATGGILGGDANFVTATVDLRRYQPLTARTGLAVGLKTSLQGGTVGEDIPIYMQYNIGGANTVRGWNVKELGKELFGRNEFIFTTEYEITLMPVKAYDVFKWSVSGGLEFAFFGDIGTAWSEADELTAKRIKGGFGFGLRPIVPAVNVVRLDLGFNAHGNVEFHFGLWSKFDAQRLRLR